MGDLAECMDAGIGASGTLHRHLLAAESLDRLLKCGLHRVLAGLALPARIRRAVIFDGELETGHGVREPPSV